MRAHSEGGGGRTWQRARVQLQGEREGTTVPVPRGEELATTLPRPQKQDTNRAQRAR
jgi:hypothetical protein